jgi:putative Mn2+ efflux pump MntP
MMPPNHLLTKGRTERELYSGKAPLRPIHRAGFLIAGLFFVGFTCAMAVLLFYAGQKENIFVKCLFAAIVLGWFLLFFTLGRRMIWAALTAPSEADDEEKEEENYEEHFR